MTDVYNFSDDTLPEPCRNIYIFFKDRSGKDRMDSIPAYVNENGEIRTVFPFTDTAEYWMYQDDDIFPEKVEYFVEVSIEDYYKNSDGDLENYEFGVFRSVPSYEEFKNFLKDNFDARLSHFTDMVPKLTILNFGTEKLFSVSVYSDFTITKHDTKYNGTISLYDVNEWS